MKKHQHTTRARFAQLRMRHAIVLIMVSYLIPFCISTHLLAAHPLLETLLSELSPVGRVLGLCILLLVSLRFLFGMLAAGGRKLANMGQRGMRTLYALVFGSDTDTRSIVSLKDVALVWNDMRLLRTALSGVTPEREQARQEQASLLGRPVPARRIPSYQAHLVSEYDALLRALYHFGFPDLAQPKAMLKQVQLAPRDFTLLQQWQANLYTRLHQSQQRFQAQPAMGPARADGHPAGTTGRTAVHSVRGQYPGQRREDARSIVTGADRTGAVHEGDQEAWRLLAYRRHHGASGHPDGRAGLRASLYRCLAPFFSSINLVAC